MDLELGSPRSGDARYRLVSVNEKGLVSGVWQRISIYKVIRLSWEHRPEVIALDNPLELASDEPRLVKILSTFPPETRVIQPTRINGEARDLRRLALDLGLIDEAVKLTPGRTAYVLAQLALRGIGDPVRQVEEKTLIKVSRRRSESRGGWSQSRYKRRLRAAVYQAASHVKKALEEAGVEYEHHYKRSIGGLESASFVVYAGYDKVKRILDPIKTRELSVSIIPVYRTIINVGQSGGPQTSRPIIVGIDPGITTGVAVINLAGDLLAVESRKDWDMGELISFMARHGKPVLLAIDVSKVPESVRRIASKLGARIYCPGRDMSEEEKRAILARLSTRPGAYSNTHERDALASALKAYSALREKLARVEDMLEQAGIEVEADSIKKLVIEGHTVADAFEKALEQALSHLSPAKEEHARGYTRVAEAPAKIPQRLLEELETLRATKIVLQRRIGELEARLKEKDLEIRGVLAKARAEAARDFEVQKLRSRVKALERELDRVSGILDSVKGELEDALNSIVKVWRGESIIARRIHSLTMGSIRRSVEEVGDIARGELIYVENCGVFEERALKSLHSSGIKCIVVGSNDCALKELLEELGIPVAHLGGGPVKLLNENLVVLPSHVKDKCAKLNETLKPRPRGIDLERIVKEYREERSRASLKGFHYKAFSL